jgi:hypothetical protein
MMAGKKTSTLFCTPVTMIIPKTFFIADFFVPKRLPALPGFSQGKLYLPHLLTSG